MVIPCCSHTQPGKCMKMWLCDRCGSGICAGVIFTNSILIGVQTAAGRSHWFGFLNAPPRKAKKEWEAVDVSGCF